jgi:hypothetical protein
MTQLYAWNRDHYNDNNNEHEQFRSGRAYRSALFEQSPRSQYQSRVDDIEEEQTQKHRQEIKDAKVELLLVGRSIPYLPMRSLSLGDEATS